MQTGKSLGQPRLSVWKDKGKSYQPHVRRHASESLGGSVLWEANEKDSTGDKRREAERDWRAWSMRDKGVNQTATTKASSRNLAVHKTKNRTLTGAQGTLGSHRDVNPKEQ